MIYKLAIPFFHETIKLTKKPIGKLLHQKKKKKKTFTIIKQNLKLILKVSFNTL